MFDPATIAALKANAGAPTAQGGRAQFINGRMVLPEQLVKKNRGGFATSLISEGGGAAGAAGGAAIGTALLPGIGTLAGAIIGGFAGGAGGRVAENKIRDDKYNIGSALKEGAVDGVLSGAGEAFQLAKGAKAAKGVASAATGVEDVIKAPAKTGAVENLGRSIESAAGGYGQGAKLPAGRIGAGASDAIGQNLKDLKIPAGSPESIQRALENRISNLDNVLTARYARSGAKLTTEEMGGLQTKIMQQVLDHPDIQLSKAGENQLLDKLSKLGKNPSVEDLWNFTKDIESKGINFGAGADSKMVDREAINRIFRNNIRNTLDDKIPAIASNNQAYHLAKDTNYLLKQAAADKTGGGVFATAKNLAPVKGAEAKLGSVLEKTGRVIGPGYAETADSIAGQTAKGIPRQLKLQAPASLSRALSGMNQPVGADGTDPSQQDMTGADGTDPTSQYTGSGSADQSAQSGFGDVYGEANLISDINRDPKHASDYLNLYKTLSTLDKAKQPSAAEKLQSNNLDSANAALDAAEQNLVTAGGAKGPSGYLSKIPVAGQLINPNAHTYEATKVDTALQLAKALTNSSRAPQGVFQQVLHSLPAVTDTPQVAAAKLQKLRTELAYQARAHGYSSGSGTADTSNTDLATLLAQMQGAQ